MIRSTRLLCVLACVCTLAACAVGEAQPRAVDATAVPATAPAAVGVAFSTLVASRGATVVDITTLRIGRDESPDDELEIAPERDFADRLAWPLPASVRLSQVRDLASGLILTSDGLILTSAHVVSNIDEAQVRLDDGRRFTARMVGIDRRTDVALLKIEASDLPVAIIGDSSLMAPGDWVASIGAPFGFHGSVTAGVVSATNRFLAGAGEIPFIQTDVAINPGSSGSPLFNSRGEVVAINSMIYSGSGGYMGLSFAVPINFTMKIVRQLRESGIVRRGRLGAQFQEMTPALAQSFGLRQSIGALVVRVDGDSPAHRAGLARGDVITALDDMPIVHFNDLVQQIAERAPGSSNRMEVWRHGKAQILWATLDEQPARTSAARSGAPAEWNDGLGLALIELSATRRLQMNLDGGLVVREAAGLARSEGIRTGDLILAVNDRRLDRVEDFKVMLAALPASRPVALLILRDGRLVYVPVGTVGASR